MADSAGESLRSVVRSTGREIEAAAAGRLYRAGDGGRDEIADLEVWRLERWDEAREEFLAVHPELRGLSEDELDDRFGDEIGEALGTLVTCADDIDCPEPVSLDELLSEDSLGDLRFEVSSRREFLGGKTLVAYGGPNVWVSDDCVRGYWGCSESSYGFGAETRDALYEWFKEQYEAAFR